MECICLPGHSWLEILLAGDSDKWRFIRKSCIVQNPWNVEKCQ